MNRVNKLINTFIPKNIYNASNHNILAIVFVLMVILVAQHPNLFSKPINSTFGKLLILVIVILLTGYNIVIGLSATLIVIGLYIDLFGSKSGYEGFVEGMCPDPSNPNCPTPTITGDIGTKPTKSMPASVPENPDGPAQQPLAAPVPPIPAHLVTTPVTPATSASTSAPATSAPAASASATTSAPAPTATPVTPATTPTGPSMVDRQFSATAQVAGVASKTIPVSNKLNKNSTVEPFSMNDSKTLLTPSFIKK
jgi:hypothetical protein